MFGKPTGKIVYTGFAAIRLNNRKYVSLKFQSLQDRYGTGGFLIYCFLVILLGLCRLIILIPSYFHVIASFSLTFIDIAAKVSSLQLPVELSPLLSAVLIGYMGTPIMGITKTKYIPKPNQGHRSRQPEAPVCRSYTSVLAYFQEKYRFNGKS